MDFESAKTLAEQYYAERGAVVTKIYDAADCWIFFAEKNGMAPIGIPGLSIEKATGNTGRFRLPNRENFEILRTAKPIIIKPR